MLSNMRERVWTAEEVENILVLAKSLDMVSLNMPIGHDEEELDTELGELIPSNEPSPEEICIKHDRETFINKCIDTVLTEKQAMIIKMRFGFDKHPMTLEEVGRELHLTRERVRQIEARALRKLKAYFMRHKISEETV